MTLLGMVLTVFSLWLPWKVQNISNALANRPGAIKIDTFDLTVTGFGLGLHWPLLVCSALCSTALLWPVTARNRVLLIAIQASCAVVCFLIALRFIAPLSGVICGIVGSALLVFGAVDRYSASMEPEGPSAR